MDEYLYKNDMTIYITYKVIIVIFLVNTDPQIYILNNLCKFRLSFLAIWQCTLCINFPYALIFLFCF